jgi:hypothetical protein
MAKRPILPENYNPIGDRLQRATSIPTPSPLPSESETSLEVETTQSDPVAPLLGIPVSELAVKSQADPLSLESDHGQDLKESSFRFRCSASERRKWHSIAIELTGENGQLSPIVRASLLLIESCYDELKRMSPDIKRLRRPAKQDSLAWLFYEHRLAEYIYDALKASGRPKWQL